MRTYVRTYLVTSHMTNKPSEHVQLLNARDIADC